MKKVIIFALALVSLNSMAFTMKEIKGKYSVSAQDIPVLNVVTISENGNVKLVEQTFEGDMTCQGKGILNNDIFKSSLTCENGEKFEQRINLKGVKSLNKFKAKVYSSLYQVEVEMNFERLK